MPEYRVIWEIDLDAPTARQAAKRALEIQRDPDSIATVFDVVERIPGDYPAQKRHRVDLTPDAG